MPTVTPFPPAAPTISGANLTLSVFLNNPARVQKTLEQLSLQRFVADKILTTGPAATGGAVIHDQITANNLFTNRDVQEIKPNSEFPIVNGAEPEPLVALVKKWGGSAVFSYEQVRRNRLDVLRRELVRLRNTIARKVDAAVIAALDAASPQTQSASGDWSTAATDIISDIETAKNKIDVLDMGYEAAWVLLNPAQALDIRKDADIRAALPRERRDSNLLDRSAADLDGILGLRWFVSNRVTAGTVYVGEPSVGFISDEIPGPYTRVVNEETKERYRVMAARVPAIGITDPKAVVKITGA